VKRRRTKKKKLEEYKRPMNLVKVPEGQDDSDHPIAREIFRDRKGETNLFSAVKLRLRFNQERGQYCPLGGRKKAVTTLLGLIDFHSGTPANSLRSCRIALGRMLPVRKKRRRRANSENPRNQKNFTKRARSGFYAGELPIGVS